MRGAVWRLLVACLACCGMGLLGSQAVAFGEGAATAGPTGPSYLGSLVVPGVQPLEEGEGLKAQEEARRHSPEAVVAREESELKYSGLNSEEAGKVTREVFPSLVMNRRVGLRLSRRAKVLVAFPLRMSLRSMEAQASTA